MVRSRRSGWCCCMVEVISYRVGRSGRCSSSRRWCRGRSIFIEKDVEERFVVKLVLL